MTLGLGLAACSPSKPELSSDEATQIVREVRSLAAITKAGECANKSDWPSAVRALEPESVCRRSTGFVIRIWSFSVEEKGYFVPDEGELVDTQGGVDPKYSQIHGSLYWYHAKG